MPRTKSVILTPTEKKVAVEQLKSSGKDLKTKRAALTAEIKAAEKAHATFLKDKNKALKALDTDLGKNALDLAKLNPPKPAAAPAV